MTILYALFAFFMLVLIFGVTCLMKGLKAALIATGLLFVGFLVVYMGMIYLIVNSMD